MRLLQFTDGGALTIRNYANDKRPPYAILSHTWLTSDEEVLYQELNNDAAKKKPGYAKILFCGQQAKKDDLHHFWVDSCCINRTDSAELSESILSMYRWYEQAVVCYVYLHDVTALKRQHGGDSHSDWERAFRRSRWFTRGWTLQELIAPKQVVFWSRDGHRLGTREDLKHLIADITNIPVPVLSGASPLDFSINERLRWAANRETSRSEDKAYCLFGLFKVFLPPMYGEGDHAFVRLRHELESSRHITPGLDVTKQLGRRNDLLQSLPFEQMDARRMNIKDAQLATCEWILQDPDYITWNARDKFNQQQGILWIAGKPGAGKSTIMKFALVRTLECKRDDELVLSFFFNARGVMLEKCALGMYRSLAFQLLSKLPDLPSVLDDLTFVTEAESQSPNWTTPLLQNLLVKATRTMRNRRLKIFIDALDECDVNEIQDMVEFFETLHEPGTCDSRVDICFASRHYPTVVINYGSCIILERQNGHADDLKKFVQGRLRLGNSKAAREIQTDVLIKANGIFLWAALVVDILNKEKSSGRMRHIKKRLKEIPAGLTQLFQDLLRKDGENMTDLLLCLQWILFAERPLAREEFYFAMEAGLHDQPEGGGTWIPEPWDQEFVTADDMDRFVASSSKGLAEVIESATRSTVQFIHESVRDYLVKDGGLCEMWPEFVGQDLRSYSHDRLSTCCLNYFTADLSSFVDVIPELDNVKYKMILLQKEISDTYPFLEYCLRGILYHADQCAEELARPRLTDTLDLDSWIRKTNIFRVEHASSPYCVVTTTAAYVYATEGCPRLMGEVSPRQFWSRCEGNTYIYPAVSAFARGAAPVLKVLLGEHWSSLLVQATEDPGFGKFQTIDSGDDALIWAISHSNWGFARCLVDCLPCGENHITSSTSKEPRKVQNALLEAAYNNEPSLIKPIKDRGALLDGSNREVYKGRIALHVAVKRANVECVEQLLDCGANINNIDAFGRTALHEAANFPGQTLGLTLTELLLGRGADVNACGVFSGETVLHVAARHGHASIVALLLDHGAYVDAEFDGQTALQVALSHGHVSVATLLLDKGASVQAECCGCTAPGETCGGYCQKLELTSDDCFSAEDAVFSEFISL
ncbi:hypothetical protein CKM354_000815200 [Cercospora kikuchii]|uniref:Heterokaryon incompatibility domain-containing protein n=1 Tax=Cercospora kikuchii TaxID=84275 RepID=A0A9P3CVA9_9PEZI|nr:uncharacterized protein CKM354_000815200 [Cercospora kikuchii]GIZ44968.1 hypothetical protein CKM354_000815200 [Cercospora kikuchii]